MDLWIYHFFLYLLFLMSFICELWVLEGAYERKYTAIWPYSLFLIVLPAALGVIGASEYAPVLIWKTPLLIGGFIAAPVFLYTGKSWGQRMATGVFCFAYMMIVDMLTMIAITALQPVLHFPFDPMALSGRDYTVRMGYNGLADVFVMMGTIRPFRRLLIRKKDPVPEVVHLNIFLFLFVLIQIIPLTYTLFIVIQYSRLLFVAAIFGCIAMDLYLIYIFNSLSKRYALERDMMVQKQQNSMQATYLETIDRQNTHLHTLIHDMKNHMQVLESLYRSGDYSQAEGYSRKIITEMDAEGPVRYCTNRTLNMILSDKAQRCAEKGIAFEAKLEGTDLAFIEPFDLTTIFANLLDNAIAAVGDLEKGVDVDKKITLTVHRAGEMAAIGIVNPCTMAADDGKPKEGHYGIGLKNVSQVVERYNGVFAWQKENHRFESKILMPIPEAAEIPGKIKKTLDSDTNTGISDMQISK